jgi:hypothetical protein
MGLTNLYVVTHYNRLQEDPMLPADVINEDFMLEGQVSGVTEKLAQLRWHWTLDESNPERVTVSEYAREVERGQAAIRRSAAGYEAWINDASLTLADHMARVQMGPEKIEAARILGIPPVRARDTRTEEGRQVRDLSEQLKKVERKERDATDKNTAYRWLELSGTLAKAKQMLVAEVPAAQRVTFESDEIETLTENIREVRTVLDLLQMAVAGTTNVNWDEELAKVVGS